MFENMNSNLKKALLGLLVSPLFDLLASILIITQYADFLVDGYAGGLFIRYIFVYAIRVAFVVGIAKGYKWPLHVLAVFTVLALVSSMKDLGYMFELSSIAGLLELISFVGSIGSIIFCYVNQDIQAFFDEH